MTSVVNDDLKNGSESELTEDQKRLLKYYSASQWTLIWWRFRRHRTAMIAASLLIVMALFGIFAEFVAPYGPTSRNTKYLDGAPQIPQFCDQNGCSMRPFIHGVSTKRDPVTLRAISVPDPNKRV